MGLFGSSEEKRKEKAIALYQKADKYADRDGYLKAAKLGHVSAMYKLGRELMRYPSLHRKEAVEWFARAAEEGDCRAR